MQSSDGLIYYFLTLKQIGLCMGTAAVSMQLCSGHCCSTSGVLQLTAGNDEVLRETCSDCSGLQWSDMAAVGKITNTNK